MTSLMKNHNNGFTLIEMLAVLFIMGIIFSLTLPAFGPMLRTLKLTTSAENLANTLESARQYAITSGQYCGVVFPITGDKAYKAYKMYNYDEGKTIGKLEVIPNGISIDPKTDFMGQPMSITFSDDDSSTVTAGCVKFKPSGSGDTGGNIYLLDPDSGNFQKITISSTPLKVKVYDLNEDPKEEK